LLKVDKSGLSDDHSEANLNTVILKSILPLSTGDFLYGELQISED
jgi:hypothetical protein